MACCLLLTLVGAATAETVDSGATAHGRRTSHKYSSTQDHLTAMDGQPNAGESLRGWVAGGQASTGGAGAFPAALDGDIGGGTQTLSAPWLAGHRDVWSAVPGAPHDLHNLTRPAKRGYGEMKLDLHGPFNPLLRVAPFSRERCSVAGKSSGTSFGDYARCVGGTSPGKPCHDGFADAREDRRDSPLGGCPGGGTCARNYGVDPNTAQHALLQPSCKEEVLPSGATFPRRFVDDGSPIPPEGRAPRSPDYDGCAASVCNAVPARGYWDPDKDDLTRCTEVDGDVFVRGSLTDANAPKCMRVLRGSLVVGHNKLVTSMYGLGNLREITRDLRVTRNAYLTSLQGLNNLRQVGGSVYVTDNDALMSLSALDALVFHQGDTGAAWRDRARRRVDVRGDDLASTEAAALMPNDMGGLATVLRDDELHFPRRVRSRPAAVDGTPNVPGHMLRSVLPVSDELDAMVGLRGLDALESIGGDLYIGDNFELLDLQGLGALKYVNGSMLVFRNFRLNNLNGASSLVSVGFAGGAARHAERGANNGDVFQNLQNAGGGGGGDAGLYPTNRLVDAYNDTRGDFVVKYNDNLRDFTGVEALERVAGAFDVSYNSQLRDFTGLQHLESVGGAMSVFGNVRLREFAGVANLRAVGGNLRVYDNLRLTALAGLGGLETVGGDFIVHNHPDLTDVVGLGSLRLIRGEMYVQGDQLQNYEGMEKLEEVSGSITVHDMPVLSSLRGLTALKTVGEDFLVYLNDALKDLDGLSALETVGGNFYVHHNMNLTHCGEFTKEELCVHDKMNGTHCGDELLLEELYAARRMTALKTVGGYLQLECLRGSVDCPQGTGVTAGSANMMAVVPEASTAWGNWCTLNCNYPYVTRGNVVLARAKRMWDVKEEGIWEKAPECHSPLVYPEGKLPADGIRHLPEPADQAA